MAGYVKTSFIKKPVRRRCRDRIPINQQHTAGASSPALPASRTGNFTQKGEGWPNLPSLVKESDTARMCRPHPHRKRSAPADTNDMAKASPVLKQSPIVITGLIKIQQDGTGTLDDLRRERI
jgi:hypothetical protein